MAITETTVEGYIESAVTYTLAGSYALARQYLAAAEIALNAIPDTTQDGIRSDWRWESISRAYATLDALQKSSASGPARNVGRNI